MSIDRKTFLLQLTSAGWLLGCGGGGGYSGGSPAPATGSGSGCSATINGNHGHELTITAADLDSTTAMTFDIRGSADHTHSVTFTAAQLAQLKAGNTVDVTTTTTLAHEHAISEHCV